MFIYKVKTAELAPHLQKMQLTQNACVTSDAGLNIDEIQPLRSIPCNMRITAIRERYGIEMGSVTCGTQNINSGTTELCDACHTIFKDALAQGSKTDEKPLNFFEKCKKFAQDHPFLTSAAVAFPVLCSIASYGLYAAQGAHTKERVFSGPEPSTSTPTTTLTTEPTTTVPTTQPTTVPTTQPLSTTTASVTQPVPTTLPSAVPTTLPTTLSTTKFTTKPATTKSTTAESTTLSTKPTTTTTKKAITAKPQRPTPPNYSVAIKKASDPNERDTVVITTRKVMPKISSKGNCFTTIPLYNRGKYDYAGIQITNNCPKPLLITTVKKVKGRTVPTGKTCFVERRETKKCMSPSQSFSNRFGSNVKFSVPIDGDQNQAITTKITEQGDVIVNLPAPKLIPQQLVCMDMDIRGKNKVICTNKCNEPILFSIVNSKEVEKSILMQPQDSQTLSLSQLPKLRGNTLPEIIQKPEFIK